MQGTDGRRILPEFLKDGSESNMAVDGSSTAVEYVYSPSVGVETDVNAIMLIMKCNTDRTTGFGNGSALANGIKLQVKDSSNTVICDLVFGLTVKVNDDLLIIVDGNEVEDTKNYHGTRYYKAPFGTVIKLNAGEKLVCTIQDDLRTVTSGITELRIGVCGLLSKSE